MKQIIAILKEERVADTREALEANDIQGVMFLHVTGRGRQKGRVSAHELGESLNRNLRMQLVDSRAGAELPGDGNAGAGSPFHSETGSGFGFLPKRMLIIVANDEEVNRIVQLIVNANHSGQHGDGRIFICPMISALQVRTGERGDNHGPEGKSICGSPVPSRVDLKKSTR